MVKVIIIIFTIIVVLYTIGFFNLWNTTYYVNIETGVMYTLKIKNGSLYVLQSTETGDTIVLTEEVLKSKFKLWRQHL